MSHSGFVSPSSASSTKHFVWSWGRLCPAPLLLPPAHTGPTRTRATNTNKHGRGSQHGGSGSVTNASSPRHLSSPGRVDSSAGDDGSSASFVPVPQPLPNSQLHTLTLSPTLVETMETNSVRAVHTAAHHTIAITHGGHLYSWRHGGLAESGPAVEVDPLEYDAVHGRSSEEARARLARLRSGPTSPYSPSNGNALIQPTKGDHTVTLGYKASKAALRARSDSPVRMGLSGTAPSSRVPAIARSNLAGSNSPQSPVPDRRFRPVVFHRPQSNNSHGAPHHVSIAAASCARNTMLAVTSAGQVYEWDWTNVEENSSTPPSASSPASNQSSSNNTSPSSDVSDESSSSTALGVFPRLLPLPSPAASGGMGPLLVNGVACGGNFNIIATGGGEAYSWGKMGTHGRLGQGINTDPDKDNKPGADSTDSSGSPSTTPTTPTRPQHSSAPSVDLAPVSTPHLLAGLQDDLVSKVAAGWSHGAVILAAGEILLFGCGLGGRLGSGNQLDQFAPQRTVGMEHVQVVEVACGYHHTLAIDVMGKVWVFGNGDCGQLGLGDTLPRATPQLLTTFSRNPHRVSNTNGEDGAEDEDIEIVQIAAGAFHSAAISAVGDLYTWGNGSYGQLGFGDTSSSPVPRVVSALNGMDVCLVACGGEYTVAITDHFMRMQMDYFSQTNAGGYGAAEYDQYYHHHPHQYFQHPVIDDDDDGGRSIMQPHKLSGGDTSPPVVDGLRVSAVHRSGSVSSTHPPSLGHSSTSPVPSPSMSRSGSGANLAGVNWPASGAASASASAAVSASAVSGAGSGSVSGRVSPSLPVSHVRPAPTPVIFEEADAPQSKVMRARTYSNADQHHNQHTNQRARAGTSGNTSIDYAHASRSSIHATHASAAAEASYSTSHTPARLSPSHSSSSIGAACSSSLSPPIRPSSPSFSTSSSRRTLFQLVQDVFSFPDLPNLDVKSALPTIDPLEDVAEEMNDEVAEAMEHDGNGNGNASGATSPSRWGKSRTPSTDEAISALSGFRPSSLFRKSESDVARHRAEVARMSAAYQAKLRKDFRGQAHAIEQERRKRAADDKASKKNAQRSLQREQRLDEAANAWLKQIIPNWATTSANRRAKELLERVGVPPRIRGTVWPLALGNTLMITPELYEIFGQQATRARRQRLQELKMLAQRSQDVSASSNSSDSTSPTAASTSSLVPSQSFTLGKESTFAYIDVDLTRTYPSLAFFQDECPMNEQLRHLLYTYCFPENDHQILTEHGFMFLHEVEQALVKNPQLRFASYSPNDGSLTYHPATLIVNPSSRQHLVSFMNQTEAARWSPNSDEYGRTHDEQQNGSSSTADHLSLLVTPEHDMYVKWGEDRGESARWRTRKSSDTVANRPCGELPYEKRSAGSLVDRKNLAIKFLGHAHSGRRPSTPTHSLPFVDTLALHTPTAIDAFLQVYGFWLGCGSVVCEKPRQRHRNRANDSALIFSASGEKHEWLAQQLLLIGLRRDNDFATVDHVVEVNHPAWVRLFRQSYLPSKTAEATTEKSMTSWVWSLAKDQARCIMSGMRRADVNRYSTRDLEQNAIITPSVRLRDQLLQLCLHAGYSAYFRLVDKRDACQDLPTKRDQWIVYYTEDSKKTEPVLRCSTDVKQVEYIGRTWCVTLPSHTAGIIVARRARTAPDGVIKHASMPLLVGNCFYRPDVGYVQGMSYLAGNLLLYMSPFDAFVSFAHLLNSPFFHVFLKLETDKMQERYRVFEDLLKDVEPELAKHLHQEGIAPELFLMEWCMTLFTKRLGLDVVGRVWDHYLLTGESVVYRTAAAIMRVLKPELIHAPFDQIMKKLNQVPMEISEQSLMSAFSEIRLSSSLKQRLRALNPFFKDE